MKNFVLAAKCSKPISGSKTPTIRSRKGLFSTLCYKSMAVVLLLAATRTGTAQEYVQPCPPPEIPEYNIPAYPACEINSFDMVIGTNVGLGTSSLVGDNLTGLTVLVDGNFTVNEAFSFNGCTVVVDAGTIAVTTSTPLTTTFTVNNTFIRGCNKMWQGIRLNGNTRIASRNISRIEDAEIAIRSSALSWLDLRHTTFNRNRVGLHLLSTGQGIPVIERLQSCGFLCTSFLSDPINPTALSETGIISRNVPLVVASINGIINIEFNQHRFGILDQSLNNQPLTIFGRNLRFNNIREDGIRVLHGNITLIVSTFTNCVRHGINADVIHYMRIQGGSFRFDQDLGDPLNENKRYGIFVKSFAMGASMEILSGTLFFSNLPEGTTDKPHGIWLNGSAVGAGTRVLIHDARFDFTGNQFFGIYLNGVFPIQSSVYIFDNSFEMEVAGLNANDSNGIHCDGGDKNNMGIYRNNPFEGKPAAGKASTGIYLIGSSGENNYVSYNTFPTDYSYSDLDGRDNFQNAIRVDNFENTKYCGNSIGDCVRQFWFRFNCAGTSLFANTMRGGGRAFWLEGIIGNQGVSDPIADPPVHIASANIWYKKFPFTQPLYSALCENTDCAQSLMIVHTPPTPISANQPSFYPELARISPQSGWFVEDLQAVPLVCSIDHFNGDPPSKDLYHTIADEGVITSTTAAEIWQLDRHLYKKLRHNPALLSEYANYSSFLYAKSSGSVGKFYEVQELIKEAFDASSSQMASAQGYQSQYEVAIDALSVADSLLTVSTDEGVIAYNLNQKTALINNLAQLDSVSGLLETEYRAGMAYKLSQAQQLNATIAATAVYETNEKTVNDLWLLSQLQQSGNFTESQMDTLRDIAAQCPAEGGQAVYRARGLMPACEQGIYSADTTDCGGNSLRNPNEGRTHGASNHDGIVVYPNPAQDILWVNLPAEQYANVSLITLTGSTVRAYSCAGGENRLSLSELPNGIYLCHIQTREGVLHTEKIVVQH